MQAMLQQKDPEDLVIGTNETHSVREFLRIAFGELDLDYEDFLVVDPRFYRPAEVDLLISDSSHARKKLNWEPSISFKELVVMMVKADYQQMKTTFQ